MASPNGTMCVHDPGCRYGSGLPSIPAPLPPTNCGNITILPNSPPHVLPLCITFRPAPSFSADFHHANCTFALPFRICSLFRQLKCTIASHDSGYPIQVEELQTNRRFSKPSKYSTNVGHPSKVINAIPEYCTFSLAPSPYVAVSHIAISASKPQAASPIDYR
jgi:hypothetical protein